MLPPFFVFRALVIAHPRWYPALATSTRQSLLAFARAMSAPGDFDPARVADLFADPLPLGRGQGEEVPVS